MVDVSTALDKRDPIVCGLTLDLLIADEACREVRKL